MDGSIVGVYVQVAVSSVEFESGLKLGPKKKGQDLEPETEDDDEDIKRIPFSVDQVSPVLIEKYGEALFQRALSKPKLKFEIDPVPSAEQIETKKLLDEYYKNNPHLVTAVSAPVLEPQAEDKSLPASVVRLILKNIHSKADDEIRMGFSIEGSGKEVFLDLAKELSSIELSLPLEGSLAMELVGSDLMVVFAIKGFKGRKLAMTVDEWQKLKLAPALKVKTWVIQ